MTTKTTQKVRLVLLGGGHTNTQIVKHIRKSTLKHTDNVELILVSDYNTSLYSGMCPGGIAAQYNESQFSVDLIQFCKQLQWTFVCKQITEIDDTRNVLIAMDGTEIKYDLLSIDIGSTNSGLNEYEGIKEYAISTRPLKLLMDKVSKTEMDLLNNIKTQCEENDNKPRNMTVNIITVGGGCAGCELIMGITHRLNTNIEKFITDHKLTINVNIQSNIITNSDQILMRDPKALQVAVLEALKSQNINIITKHRVTKMDKDVIYLTHNDKQHTMDYNICIWSTGAAAQRIELNHIAKDENGWIKVNKYLQSVSHPNIFAAGDCVSIIDYGDNPHFPPKSGVYAVREGPILLHNLLQCLSDSTGAKSEAFQAYLPQTDFLRLLNTGNGKAIGCKHGISFKGTWVWRLKDWIDVSWMNKFAIDNLLKEDSKHFKPQTKDDQEEKKQNEPKPVENAVKVLSIDDNPDKCDGFALQWKVLLRMNDDGEFCDEVVKLFKECQLKN